MVLPQPLVRLPSDRRTRYTTTRISSIRPASVIARSTRLLVRLQCVQHAAECSDHHQRGQMRACDQSPLRLTCAEAALSYVGAHPITVVDLPAKPPRQQDRDGDRAQLQQ